MGRKKKKNLSDISFKVGSKVNDGAVEVSLWDGESLRCAASGHKKCPKHMTARWERETSVGTAHGD